MWELLTDYISSSSFFAEIPFNFPCLINFTSSTASFISNRSAAFSLEMVFALTYGRLLKTSIKEVALLSLMSNKTFILIQI